MSRERDFYPINDQKIRLLNLCDSRNFLSELGIDGEIIATPGHSDDGISLCLDDGTFFVGDLNPLYEFEMHHGTRIGKSWKHLLARHPKVICYGHAKTAVIDVHSDEHDNVKEETGNDCQDYEYALVKRIMKYTDKGYSAEKIQRKTNASIEWVRGAMRMYLTHKNISVQGIMDRMEIRGR